MGLWSAPLDAPQNLDVAAATNRGLGRIAVNTDRQLAARGLDAHLRNFYPHQTLGHVGSGKRFRFVLVVETRNLFEIAWRPDCRRYGRMRALLFAGACMCGAANRSNPQAPCKPMGLLLRLPG